jgi:hypothetical protein
MARKKSRPRPRQRPEWRPAWGLPEGGGKPEEKANEFQWAAFGKVKFGGQIYHDDMLVNSNGVVMDRLREGDGHSLTAEELALSLDKGTNTLVFGTGNYGVAAVTPEARAFLKNNRIRLVAKTTPLAVKEWNRLVASKRPRIQAIIHATC